MPSLLTHLNAHLLACVEHYVIHRAIIENMGTWNTRASWLFVRFRPYAYFTGLSPPSFQTLLIGDWVSLRYFTFFLFSGILQCVSLYDINFIGSRYSLHSSPYWVPWTCLVRDWLKTQMSAFCIPTSTIQWEWKCFKLTLVPNTTGNYHYQM